MWLICYSTTDANLLIRRTFSKSDRQLWGLFQPILGKLVQRKALLDKKLAKELKALHNKDDPYETIVGKTLCTTDFYEGPNAL